MSTQIGTNFNYKGARFLDSRQGVESKRDLLNWDFEKVPVPLGFELCLSDDDGEIWYYYDPNVTYPETGHWIPRLVGTNEITAEGSIVNGDNRGVTANAVADVVNSMGTLQEMVDQLTGNQFKIEGKVYFGYGTNVLSPKKIEVGQTLNLGGGTGEDTAYLTYKFEDSGNTLISPKTPQYYALNNTPTSITRNQGDNLTWEYTISGIQYIKKTSRGQETVTTSLTAKCTWGYCLLYGEITQEGRDLIISNHDSNSVTSALPSGIKQGDFVTNGTMGSKIFNCTGGKYPCIMFPTKVLGSNGNSWTPVNVIIGGLSNSDYSVYNAKVIRHNSENIVDYRCIILNHIQTGSNISISISLT